MTPRCPQCNGTTWIYRVTHNNAVASCVACEFTETFLVGCRARGDYEILLSTHAEVRERRGSIAKH